MRLSVLEQAKRKFAKGKYHEVISLLEPNVIQYASGDDADHPYNPAFNKSFPFYLYLGLACLHTGDIGGAVNYLKCARRIKMTDPDLLCAQAALFLRKADTPRAIEYYLEAMEYNPQHKLAKEGLEFIRTHNRPEDIGSAIQSGQIKKLYPRPGVREYVKKKFVLASVLLGIGLGALLVFILSVAFSSGVGRSKRADLSAIQLEANERTSPIETGDAYRYVLSEKEVLAAYRNAQKYFQSSRDNLAQIEVNRILSSNAAYSIKQKARILMDYFSVPGFDTIKDIPAYEAVKNDISLYLDCWAVWSGIPTNIKSDGQNSSFDLLVGYGERIQLEGIVPVFCDFSVTIDTERPIEVLGRIQQRGGVLFLTARSIHQSKIPVSRK